MGAHSVARFLDARSIAVVGCAGGEFDPAARSNMGRRFVENLVRHDFEGSIYPINPKYGEIAGLRCYPSVRSVEHPVDVAVLVVARTAIEVVVDECIDAGVGSVCIVSGGFSEAGDEGRALERRLGEKLRNAGIPLLGPNCLGFMNAATGLIAFGAAGTIEQELVPGSSALIAQSGAVAVSIVDAARALGVGWRHVITTGNQYDVDTVDALEYCMSDPQVRAVAMFLESVPRGAAFRRAARAAAESGRTIVALKVGSSAEGRLQALAHTGALAGDDRTTDGVFRQDGVVRVGDPLDLARTTEALARWPRPDAPGAGSPGGGIAVVTMSGGLAGVLVDQLDRLRVPIADLSARTTERLRSLTDAGLSNPLDLGGASFVRGLEVVGDAVRILSEDEAVRGVVLLLAAFPYSARLLEDAQSALEGSGIPLMPLWLAVDAFVERKSEIRRAGLPIYESVRDLAADIAHWHHRVSPVDETTPGDVSDGFLRGLSHAAASGVRLLSEFESAELLRHAGLRFPDLRLAEDRDAAASLARELGFPVALKLHSPDIAHKNRVGGVLLNVTSQEAARVGFDRIRTSLREHQPTAKFAGVVVAPMLARGMEFLVGCSVDPTFGPTVSVGVGGTAVEDDPDVVVRAAPVGPIEAVRMIGDLRFSSTRASSSPGRSFDERALADLIVKISHLAISGAGQLAEIDLNPVIVQDDGTLEIADALVVLAERQDA